MFTRQQHYVYLKWRDLRCVQSCMIHGAARRGMRSSNSHQLLAWRQGSTRPCRPHSSCHPQPLTMSSTVDHVNRILMALPPVPGRAGRLSLLGQSVSSSSSRIVLCDGVEQLERPGIRTRWMPVRARWQASSARGPVSIARAAHAVNFSHISSLML